MCYYQLKKNIKCDPQAVKKFIKTRGSKIRTIGKDVDPKDKIFTDMFMVWLNTNYFYFSHDYDQTNNLGANLDKIAMGNQKVNVPQYGL